MKRPTLILIAGLVAAVAAYCGIYHAGTANCCRMEQGHAPELAWLKQEFHLSAAEFTRISQMHEQYLAGCAERCHRIDLKNQALAQLLTVTNAITPEIEKALTESALLRAECQKKMLQHFYDVSRTMPPEQGQRYLAWVQSKTVLSDSHSQMHH
ncbi:MAG: periplasmic heavy metal sensor [Verrucomicrobiota bacterium]|jgi:hypothetical protein